VTDQSAKRILLVAPKCALQDLNALTTAWTERGIEVCVQGYNQRLPAADTHLLDGEPVDAMLLAGDARRAPSTVLPGPTLECRDGRRLAVSWLPLRSPETTRQFAAAAARVQRRERQQMAVALLSQWHPRYLRVADRVDALLSKKSCIVRWTGDVIDRDGMLKALGTGLGLGLYFGHGRPTGWVGYRGVRGHHFSYEAAKEPLGALLSLCCRTASRRRTGLSYSEALPLRGVAASSLGAVTDTLFTDNTRWALGLCNALSEGATTIGELIVKASPPSQSRSSPYRLFGDPLAPLTSTDVAVAAALQIETYP